MADKGLALGGMVDNVHLVDFDEGFKNITLRRITVVKPWLSPGVILGNESNPMQVLIVG